MVRLLICCFDCDVLRPLVCLQYDHSRLQDREDRRGLGYQPRQFLRHDHRASHSNGYQDQKLDMLNRCALYNIVLEFLPIHGRPERLLKGDVDVPDYFQ
jgi:hypothetical protein